MATEFESVELPHCIEIYIPSQCRCGQPLPEDVRKDALEETRTSLANWFGGNSIKSKKLADVRVESIEGSWPLKNGDRADEKVDVLYSNASSDLLNEHVEEVFKLTADLANRLTQEGVACRIDEKMRIFPSTSDPKPHRCGAGVSAGVLPPEIQPDEKNQMRGLQAALQRLSSKRDVRDLFCNLLNYEYQNEEISTSNWPEALTDCLANKTTPQIIAGHNDFRIIYIQLAEPDLRKSHERKLIQRLLRDDPTLRGLIVVSNEDQRDWHLINAEFEKEEKRAEKLRLRRMRVGANQRVRTAVERLMMIDIGRLGEEITAADLQELHNRAFDVESVSKEFFREISNWYFWALSQEDVQFPNDRNADETEHRATSLIRFLTRIIFCWFLKEKRLVPEILFNPKFLADILVDLNPDSCTYHQGILQNLFFATLNQRMGKDNQGNSYRSFADELETAQDSSTQDIDTHYRYQEHFNNPSTALSYFAEVPFLNGGLFECLDRFDEKLGKKIYVDGFSKHGPNRATIPNRFLFGLPEEVDLSGPEAYGEKTHQNDSARGLIHILHTYNFTIEENTPFDEEVALDPELLGKVFENLLASYNPETRTTARKQTGSFYTPRPIVEYMVDESLKSHLITSLTKLKKEELKAQEQLDLLLGYSDEIPLFSAEERTALLEAIHTCKILDPACGSGAFPMGMLRKLLHIIQKLDPHNDTFEHIQLEEAKKIEDRQVRHKRIQQIGKDFSEQNVDYARKLYLIENCLFGVDIQPIAVQITKLRFFISLICEQRHNHDKKKNHGVRALPNLETKFVAADTLIGLTTKDQLEFVSPRMEQIEDELESLYHRHFTADRRDIKIKIQKKVKTLRKELATELTQSLGSSQRAKYLSEWDPFDSQVSSDFFDPHWMFGKDLLTGFDIVLGNPPYNQIQKFPVAQKNIWQACRYKTYGATADIYCLFYERGSQLLKKGGALCYITSNKWMRAGYGEKLRKYLASQVNTHSILDFGMAQNFGEATTYTCIVQLANEANQSKTMSCYAKDDRAAMANPAGYFQRHAILQKGLNEKPWVVVSKERQRIKSLVEQQGTPLSEWDIQINYGIKTGFNEAFYISSERRNQLIAQDAACEQLIKPLLRGRNIERYGANWDQTWMIATFPALNLDEKDVPRPIIKHLESYLPKLNQSGEKFLYADGREEKTRKKTEHKWFETQDSIGYYEQFAQPKIIYQEIAVTLPFYFDRDDNMFMDTTCFMISSPTCALAYLTATLNSSLFRCCFKDNFPEYSGNAYRVKKIFVDKIPIREATSSETKTFDPLVSLIQCSKRTAHSAAQFLEHLIDACVMESYFHEHMAERDLLFIEELAPHLAGYNPNTSEAKQRDFLDHFHRTLNAEDSVIRDRLSRICTDSPELLAVIKEEGKV